MVVRHEPLVEKTGHSTGYDWLERHGFALHKGAFRYAIALRYGRQLQFCPTQCSCGARFEPDHMMTCHQGCYISLHHNELRDMTASMMAEAFVDVEVKQKLKAVVEECLPGSANRSEEARLDVRVRGFWG